MAFVMNDLFPTVLNMSLTASLIIAFILIVRLILRRAPKVFSYALWLVVLFRLLCPVSISTDVSLLGFFDVPVKETQRMVSVLEHMQPGTVEQQSPQIQAPTPNDGAVAIPIPSEPTPHSPTVSTVRKTPVSIPVLLWMCGMAAMLMYSVISLLMLRRKLVGAIRLRDNIYLADHISSPFVMGLLFPKIYLPSFLSESEQSYIVLHEQHHIKRLDHVIKILSFIALCIHWFNPLIWVAFILSGKDMEMSCDEAVIRKLGVEIRTDYSASLLRLATGHRLITGTPLAFGEGDTTSRIKNVLNWKQTKPIIAVLASAAVLLGIVVCGTNANTVSHVRVLPVHSEADIIRSGEHEINISWNMKKSIGSWAIYEEVYQNGRLISGKPCVWDTFNGTHGATPRKYSFPLSIDAECTAGQLNMHIQGANRVVVLPSDAYVSVTGVPGVGSFDAIQTMDYSIRPGDDIILYSVLFATAERPRVVYANGKSLKNSNDTVIQYRLITSAEDTGSFSDLPLDLAQTLYDLRAERSILGAQDNMDLIQNLLTSMDTYVLGDYEVSTAETDPEHTLCIIFKDELNDQQIADAEVRAALLMTLVKEAQNVHVIFPSGEQAMTYYFDKTEVNRIAKALGYTSCKELGQSAVGVRALLQYLHFETAVSGQEFFEQELFELMGLTCWYADAETTPSFTTRTYYTQGSDGKAYPIAESFGFGIDDHIVDVDGDRITELVCNCQYGGDGHESVFVYRRNGNVIERGWLDLEHLLPANWKNWGINSWTERYNPNTGMFVVRYDTENGWKTATVRHLDRFTFEEYAHLPEGTSPPPVTAENLFASMPSTFHFLSGAGGWQTELYWHGDGKFSGIFEDADAGEIYRCEFQGSMDAPRKVGDLEFSTRLSDLIYDESNTITYENGVKVLYGSPYGLDGADEIRIYLPGYPVKELPEEAVSWLRGGAEEFWDGHGPDTLPFFVLYNVKGQQAFFSSDIVSIPAQRVEPSSETDFSNTIEIMYGGTLVELTPRGMTTVCNIDLPNDGEYHQIYPVGESIELAPGTVSVRGTWGPSYVKVSFKLIAADGAEIYDTDVSSGITANLPVRYDSSYKLYAKVIDAPIVGAVQINAERGL